MKKLGLALVFLVSFCAIISCVTNPSGQSDLTPGDQGANPGGSSTAPDHSNTAQQQAGTNQQQTPDPQLNTIESLLSKINDQLSKIGNSEQAIDNQLKSIDEQLKKIDSQTTPSGNQRTPAETVGSTATADNSQTQLVPVTRELINAVNVLTPNGLGLYDLEYFLSIPIALNLATNDPKNKFTIEAGVLMVRENTITDIIEISPRDKGKLVKHTPGGKEKFDIAIPLTNPDKTVVLSFERNEQKDSYELTSASGDGITHILNINKDEPIPRLSIRYGNPNNQNAIITVNSIPAAQPAQPEGKTADPQKELPVIKIENANIQQGNPRVIVPVPAPNPPRETQNAIRIEGSGSLKKDKIVNYIISQNPAASRGEVGNLIDAYIREAQREGINHDIAVAQMCYATNFYRERQRINTRNYAGFDAINGTPVTYRTMEEGVRAHIQHLKGYASRERPQGLVDVRYNVLIATGYLGTVKTLDALFIKWAPNNAQNYGDGINRILRGLNGS